VDTRAQATGPASAALIVSIVSLPCPKPGRAFSPAQRIRFGCLIFDALVAGRRSL
jgi:hypothetical protein